MLQNVAKKSRVRRLPERVTEVLTSKSNVATFSVNAEYFANRPTLLRPGYANN